MEAEEGSKKRKLEFNTDEILSKIDEDPRPIEIVKGDTQRRQSPPPTAVSCGDESKEDYSKLKDHELLERIQRQKRTLQFVGPKLKDNGEKTRACIKALEEERERRKTQPLKNDNDGLMKSSKSENSYTAGFSNGSENEDKSSSAFSQSTLGACGSKKNEENAGCRIINLSDRSIEDFFPRKRQKNLSSSRKQNSHAPRKLSLNGWGLASSKGEGKDRALSVCSLGDTVDDQPRFLEEKKNTSAATPYRLRPRKEHAIVLVDEEVPMPGETSEEEAELPGFEKNTRIFYPSSDDPDAIEICFGDIDNLAPEAYLSSTIMNFYIRYLQKEAPPTNREICDCHFFSTYFYPKLTEAMSDKGSNKVDFFKFRRWWKGVNIFEKAYVLIPIHEQLHWSLVIICIPDKEDESGPIMLHLDSLDLHSSHLVFKNIKCFLEKEWSFLKQNGSTSNLPIGDKVWDNLPSKIYKKKIPVPQQKNDFDCGLFVLYFMERFIEEAPERLKKSNIPAFGKKWFKPEEASGLRRKIRKILIEQFEAAITE